MTVNAGTLKFEIVVDDKGTVVVKNFRKGVAKSGKEVQSATQKMAQGFKSVFKQIVGAQLLVGAIRKVIGAVGDMVKEVAKFEAEFANVTTLLDGQGMQSVDMMRAGLLEMAGELGSATELTQGLYQTISAGVTPGIQAMEFLATSAKFAKAGLVEMSASVDVLTTVINAYGLEVSKAGWVSDVLFQTIKDGKITGQELASSLGRVIPSAATLNIELEEVAAAMAIMTKSGIKSEEAVTSLNASMMALLKPGTEAIKVAKEYGIELSKFGVQKAEGFQKWLADVKEKLQGNEKAMVKLFPNIRALKAVFTLTGSQAGKYADQMERNKDVAENVNEAFKKQISTFEGVSATIKNKLTASLTKSLLPALQNLAKWLRENSEAITKAFEGLIGRLKKIGEWVGFIAKGWKALSDLIATPGKEWDIAMRRVALAKEDIARTQAGLFKGSKLGFLEERDFKNLQKQIEKTKELNSEFELKRIELGKIAEAEKEEQARIENLIELEGARRREAEKLLKLRSRIVKEIKIPDLIKKTKGEDPRVALGEVIEIKIDVEVQNAIKAKDEIKKIKTELEKTIDSNVRFGESLQAIGQQMDSTFGLVVFSVGQFFTTFSEGFKGTTKDFQKLGGLVQGLAQNIGGKLGVAVSGLGGILQNLGNPLGMVAVGVSTVISLLKKTIDWNKKAGESFEKFGENIEVTTGLVEEFGKFLEENGGKTVEFFRNLGIDELADKLEEDLMQTFSLEHLEEFEQKSGLLAEDIRANLQRALLSDDTTKEQLEAMTEFLEKELSDAVTGFTEYLKAGIKTEDQFNASMNITLGLFADMVSQGATASEAILQLDDMFETLEQTMINLGLEGNESFQQLLQFRNLIKDNEELINSINGLNNAFVALVNTGSVTKESFGDWQTLALQGFNDLIDAGFSEQQALLQMAPMLLNLKNIAEEMGIVLSDDLQKLINMGEDQGIFDGMTDPLTRVVELLELIAIQLGAVIPGAIGASIDGMRKLEKSIPVLNGNSVPGTPYIPKPNIGFASGVDNFTVPQGFNNDDYLVGLSSGEEFSVKNSNNSGNSGKGGDTFISIPTTIYAQPEDSPTDIMRKFNEGIENGDENSIGLLKEKLNV